MARIFITGSADGLGSLAAQLLSSQGHQLVLHARNQERGHDALSKVADAENLLTGDLSSMDETKALAAKANALGSFDAVIHNAGIYRASNESIFAVNSLAPYILTCLIQKPGRLVYLSSGLHMQGNPDLKKMSLSPPGASYPDSKLHNVILCMAVARLWPDVYANAVDPGWVPTKMGGPGATGNLEKGFQTQAWLAVSKDHQAMVSGRYFYHQKVRNHLPDASDAGVQERFLALCEQISGVSLPV